MGEADVGWAAFPPCRRCGRGDLVPLSDFGPQGAEVRYKAWVCTTPACGFNLKIRNGEVLVDEPVTDASAGGGGREPRAAAPARRARCPSAHRRRRTDPLSIPRGGRGGRSGPPGRSGGATIPGSGGGWRRAAPRVTPFGSGAPPRLRAASGVLRDASCIGDGHGPGAPHRPGASLCPRAPGRSVHPGGGAPPSDRRVGLRRPPRPRLPRRLRRPGGRPGHGRLRGRAGGPERRVGEGVSSSEARGAHPQRRRGPQLLGRRLEALLRGEEEPAPRTVRPRLVARPGRTPRGGAPPRRPGADGPQRLPRRPGPGDQPGPAERPGAGAGARPGALRLTAVFAVYGAALAEQPDLRRRSAMPWTGPCGPVQEPLSR